MAKVDFDSVQAFVPVPDGEYKMRVVECVEKKSKAGNDMFKLTLEIIDGEFTGRKVWDNLVIMPSTMWRVKHACEELGLPIEGMVDLVDSMFVGCEAMVKVYTEAQDGFDDQNRVSPRGYTSLGSKPAAGGTNEETAF